MTQASSLPPPPEGPGTIPVSSIPSVNVAPVPQRSPLRYPGGEFSLVDVLAVADRYLAPLGAGEQVRAHEERSLSAA